MMSCIRERLTSTLDKQAHNDSGYDSSVTLLAVDITCKDPISVNMR